MEITRGAYGLYMKAGENWYLHVCPATSNRWSGKMKSDSGGRYDKTKFVFVLFVEVCRKRKDDDILFHTYVSEMGQVRRKTLVGHTQQNMRGPIKVVQLRKWVITKIWNKWKHCKFNSENSILLPIYIV